MSASPSFSVIIVCKNPGPPLRAALSSVWAQEGMVPELIVIDGASTDGTPEWLEKERSRIASLRSEADTGIYDAMNKGIAAATGQWLIFLGADDRIVATTTLSAALKLLSVTDAQVATGKAVYDDGRVYRLKARRNPLARNFLHHQATFYRRDLFKAHGGFDRSLSVMADYEFNVRLWQKKVRFESIPIDITRCASGGLSDSGRWRGYREEMTVRHRYFSFARCLLWDAASVIRFLRKKLLRTHRAHG